MGAGKTTKSRALAKERNAVLLCEDQWIETLYPDQVRSLQDYIKYSNRIKPIVKPLVQNILTTGTPVVMDFPANTIAQREWFRAIFSEIGADHELIYLDVSNQLCLKQIEKRRNEQPERNATDTEEMFAQVTKYFVAPSEEEGFNMVRISRNAYHESHD